MTTKQHTFTLTVTIQATDNEETLQYLFEDVRAYLGGLENTEALQDKVLSHYWRGGTDIQKVEFNVAEKSENVL